MTAPLWLAAAVACAQFGGMALPSRAPETRPQENAKAVGEAPAPHPASSKISAVTVYRGQALVTREVAVPEGDGTVELVVSPLPPQALDNSLYAEGSEGLRVLSTRFRSRAVKEDTRREVRAQEELIAKLQAEAQRVQKEIDVQGQDLRYLEKLEGFTGTALTGLTEKGRLDSDAVVALSKFVMENRGTKAKTETDLRQRLKANTEAVDFARRRLAELTAGSSRVERDAVIIVQRTRRAPGTVRLGYLVGSAGWTPQYRLRGTADGASVRLEYLAAVVQQTGEDWPDARLTLSTAQPSLDAAPPELLPLNMAVSAAATDNGPTDAPDDRSQRVAAELARLADMPFPNETPLEDVIKHVKNVTKGATFPDGIPIYLDPVGLQESEKTPASPVTIDLKQVPLRTSLKLALEQLGLTYKIKDGLLTVTSVTSEDDQDVPDPDSLIGMGGMGGGMGGMGGGMGMFAGQQQAAFGVSFLNQAAAGVQERELRLADRPAQGTPGEEKDGPSVTFTAPGRLDVPSRNDPQLIEVARAELPAEYFAKAVPVLTPRVYRLAKLTNKSDLVLLPGEASVYVGTDFVGRMRMPLVAAGEPFVAGFGVDPQVQVSRRLVHKARSVQGGNQVFTYEFRIGLRNYRTGPVKVQLWDRLPRPQGEAVAVNLVKTSSALSADAPYQHTSRLDNLLRWDLDVPPGTVGEKTMYLNYEFRLEYARDLPVPHFASGGLREAPIGMGGMGGAGFR